MLILTMVVAVVRRIHFCISDIVINSAYDSAVIHRRKERINTFYLANPLGVRQLRGKGPSRAYHILVDHTWFDDINKLTIHNVDSDATSNIDFFLEHVRDGIA